MKELGREGEEEKELGREGEEEERVRERERKPRLDWGGSFRVGATEEGVEGRRFEGEEGEEDVGKGPLEISEIWGIRSFCQFWREDLFLDPMWVLFSDEFKSSDETRFVEESMASSIMESWPRGEGGGQELENPILFEERTTTFLCFEGGSRRELRENWEVLFVSSGGKGRFRSSFKELNAKLKEGEFKEEFEESNFPLVPEETMEPMFPRGVPEAKDERAARRALE